MTEAVTIEGPLVVRQNALEVDAMGDLVEVAPGIPDIDLVAAESVEVALPDGEVMVAEYGRLYEPPPYVPLFSELEPATYSDTVDIDAVFRVTPAVEVGDSALLDLSMYQVSPIYARVFVRIQYPQKAFRVWEYNAAGGVEQYQLGYFSGGDSGTHFDFVKNGSVFQCWEVNPVSNPTERFKIVELTGLAVDDLGTDFESAVTGPFWAAGHDIYLQGWNLEVINAWEEGYS
jgi:hypothetical protein